MDGLPPQLRLTFLGTFQAKLDQEVITKFRSANVQGLLVYLAMQSERPFPREVLATLLWPDSPESVAKTNLRQTLYQLRKVLDDLGKKGQPFLLINRQTIQFNPDSFFELDTQSFLNAIDSNEFETAVSLYQDELLPGFTCESIEFESWLRQERERFHLLGLEAINQQFQNHLHSGNFTKAKQIAQQQIKIEPWNETGHQNLMRALAHNSEKSAALQHFQKAKDILWDELGAEPHSQTVALYKKIEQDELELIERQVTAVFTPPPKPKHNLQSSVTPFFAREKTLTLLQERITSPNYRLITLVGEGGIGKSRLANELGWHNLETFKDGTWFVPLAGLTPVQEESLQETNIALAILQACGQPLGGQQGSKEQLLSFVKEKQMLLILDNFEHLLAGSHLVIELLQSAPQLAILCTSREPLDFMAEWACPIEPLRVPQLKPIDFDNPTLTTEETLKAEFDLPSIKLFEDRANRALGQFELSAANYELVARVCNLVQGIPLGLELAAAALRQRPLPDLIQSLQRSYDSLLTQKRDIPQRHRSIRTVFENSWTLLSKHERAAFGTLSLFQGGFTHKAAETVTGTTGDVLHALRDKSLLRQEENGRFSIHELLRQFAKEKLESPEATSIWIFTDPQEFILEEHSHYYLNAVANLQDALNGETPHIPCDWIAADLDNLRLAWDTAVSNQQFQIIQNALRPLSDFYQIRGLYREGERQFGDALSRFSKNLDDKQPLIQQTLSHFKAQQAALHIRLSQYQPAIELLIKAEQLAQFLDDSWLDCRIQISWGEALWRQGQLDHAAQKLNKAYSLATENNNQQMLLGISTYHLGVIHDLKGQHDQSLSLFEDALKIFEELGNGRWQGFTQNSIGTLAQKLNQLEKAESALLRALEINQQNNDWQGQISTSTNLGLLATAKNEFEKSQSYLLQSLSLALRTANKDFQAQINYNLAWNAKQANQWKQAVFYGNQSLKINQEVGNKKREEKISLLLSESKNFLLQGQ